MKAFGWSPEELGAMMSSYRYEAVAYKVGKRLVPAEGQCMPPGASDIVYVKSSLVNEAFVSLFPEKR